jgi:hypothetical protein
VAVAVLGGLGLLLLAACVLLTVLTRDLRASRYGALVGASRGIRKAGC